MKKIAYTQPEAEMVLLLEDDVIRTSLTNGGTIAMDDIGANQKTQWIS